MPEGLEPSIDEARLQTGDAYEAITRWLETEGAAFVDQITELLNDGGKQTRRVTCPGCGRRQEVTIQSADPKQVVDTISALHRIDKERRELLAKTQRDTLAPTARLTLDTVRGMSDEEIATEIARRKSAQETSGGAA